MTFPVVFQIWGRTIQAHTFFEALAYFTGARLFQWQRYKSGDFLTGFERFLLIALTVGGAAVGSRLLSLFEDPAAIRIVHGQLSLPGGKTVVGGLLGGLLMVEAGKKALRIERRTGDLYAIPIAVGIAIGRVGCFLAGLPDNTYGLPANLPWSVDLGDGIPRHPVQFYEIAFLVTLIICLYRFRRSPHREGDVFKFFLMSYLGFRLLIDFLKPGVPLLGLTAIQWACLAGLVYYWRDLWYLMARKEQPVHG